MAGSKIVLVPPYPIESSANNAEQTNNYSESQSVYSDYDPLRSIMRTKERICCCDERNTFSLQHHNSMVNLCLLCTVGMKVKT